MVVGVEDLELRIPRRYDVRFLRVEAFSACRDLDALGGP